MASSEAYSGGDTQESGESAQGSSLYGSLKLSGHQIRLLTIKTTTPQISCKMVVAELHDQLPFNALSYVWGDPNITEIIRVNGREHPVTTSLASALRCVPQHLSQSKHAAGQQIWVDAICINQADNAEKSHQVAKMGEIYSQCGLVLCWLGPLSDSIGTAIDVIQITAFERLKEAVDMKQPLVADKTSAITRLVGDTEIYELANALEHATTVTAQVLQGPYGSELGSCKNDLISVHREVTDWHDGLRRQTSKLDANVIKDSHPVGFLLELLSCRIRRFQQTVKDFLEQAIADEGYGHILWLKEYPSLCEVEEIVGQCHRGPAQPLFDLPYWSRIWIRQAIILAKQPVFICGSRSFPLQTLEYFSAWLGWILSPSNSPWCQKEKLFKLILEYRQNWKLLHHIFTSRRDQGLPVGNWLGQSHFKTNVWCHSSEARATNPKDYYYGFLGITKLNIVPDYRSSKSIGSVSREFMSEYLKVYRDQSLSNDLLGGPLGLLMFAGVGYGWKMDIEMPSWCPNFPGEAQLNPSSRGSADVVAFPGNRDMDSIFGKEPNERITGPDMEVTLYILDRIKMIGPRVSDYGRPELLHSEGLPITWALDFALRHESYESGGHPLAALRHLLEPSIASKGRETDFPIENGLEFLKFLGRFNRQTQKIKPHSRAMLARFCYLIDFLAQVPVSVSSLTLCPRLIVKDPDHYEDEDEYTKEYRYIELLGAKCRPYNHTIAETKKGYIGRFPPRIREGDLVCLLNGLNQIAVLREADKSMVSQQEFHRAHWATRYEPCDSLIDRATPAPARTTEQEKSSKPDFSDHFTDRMKGHPDSVDVKLVLNLLLVNVLAEADTTAIALHAIFDFLFQNLHAMTKLKREILAKAYDITDILLYGIARSLPYLDAVIRGSQRTNPSVATPLDPYVPETGLTIPDGRFAPPGVVVGLSLYIIRRNEEVWEEAAIEFRPERWFKIDDEDEQKYQQRLRKMNRADLTFGGGSRICIERRVALIQI
ncbi:cytochrome P450 monooxygenase monooxygenase [Fusarium denticulatum]|uniref:Cytochrome P450 monooxygenase monooxygenase n=1 Tax=Fusarium denticulatum TaxID=48507 RepID=A0A8H5UDY0_9HYPO|nr:cytochrome P450 monooxygenase monooxygenase [Fusarium denticulatum]